MKRTRWTVWTVIIVFFVAVGMTAGCATARFQTYGDFGNYRAIWAQEKKVTIIDEIVFYHETEKRDGRDVVKGEPDTSPQYTKLASVLREEVEKQLIKRGFTIVEKESADTLRLKISGLEKKVYFMGINHLIGALTQGWREETLCFSYFRGSLYNNFFPQEKVIKDRVAPFVAKALEEVINR